MRWLNPDGETYSTSDDLCQAGAAQRILEAVIAPPYEPMDPASIAYRVLHQFDQIRDVIENLRRVELLPAARPFRNAHAASAQESLLEAAWQCEQERLHFEARAREAAADWHPYGDRGPRQDQRGADEDARRISEEARTEKGASEGRVLFPKAANQ